MSGLKKLQNELKAYTRKYRKPGLPPLRLSPLYDLCTTHKRGPAVGSKWPDYWPNADSFGVYAIFDESLDLLYIGKASMNNVLSNRLGRWFGYTKAKSCKVKDSNWNKTPRYVITIPVVPEMRFEAAAIEEYMIAALQPIDNTRGKKPKDT